MKTTTTILGKKVLFVICFSLLSFLGIAQPITGASHVTFSLKNCLQIDSKNFEFDLTMINDGTVNTTTMQISACTFGMNYSPTIVNGGTLSFSVATNTTQTSSTQSVTIATPPTPNYFKATLGVRLDNSGTDAANLPWGTELRICRIHVHNTADFTTSSSPAFALQEVTGGGSGQTRTNGGCWVNVANGSGGTGNITSFNGSGAGFGVGNNQASGTVGCNLTLNDCNVTATASNLTAVSCFGGSNGSALITLTGSGAPLTSGTYAVDGVGTTPYSGSSFTVSGLATGNHTVTVTNNSTGNCSATTSSFNIGTPTAVAPTEGHTAIACFGGTSTVTITGVGGTPPYVSGTGTFQQAGGTTQSYIVTDSHGCTGSVSVTTAAAPTQLVAHEIHTTIGCFGGMSTVTISATGGTPGTGYTGTGDFQQAAGTTVQYNISDANSCTASISVTTNAPTQLVAHESHTTVLCAGGMSTVTISSTGGTGAITGTGDFQQAAGTTQTYFIHDNNECPAQIDVTVAPAAADVTPPNISACGPTQNAVADNSGNATVPDFTSAVVATDNCTATNLLTITQSPLAGSTVGVGNNAITITVTDASNNSSQCTTHFNVTSGCNFTIGDSIVGPKNACPYMGGTGTGISTPATYHIDATSASTYAWTVPVGAIGFTGQGTSTISFKFPTTFTGLTNNVVSVIVTSACGGPDTVRATIGKHTPVVGAMSGPVNACAYIGTATEVTYAIAPVAGATGYLWTVTSGVITIVRGQGTDTIAVTFQTNAASSISVIALSGCANSAAKKTTISLVKPAMPGTITGPTNACIYIPSVNNAGSEATYTIRKVANTSNYVWSVGGGVGATITSHPGGAGTANDTIITVAYDNNFVSNTPVSVQAQSICGISNVKNLLIKRTGSALPGTVTGPADACPLMISATNPSGTEATYWIHKALQTTGYIWNVPAGATITSHPSGAAGSITDTMITVIFDASYIGGSMNPITVQSTNGCGVSNIKTKVVSRLIPMTPGVITGNTDPCPIVGTPTRYWIRKVTNATGYIWNVAGASFTHENGPGVTDTAIFITWAAGSAATSPVSVQATNNCWVSAAKTLVILRKLPATPGAITASAPTACPNRQVTYSLATLPLNATSVSWILPSGASMVSQTALSITVLYPNTAVSDTIRVIAVNLCSNSAQKKLKVSLAVCTGFTAGPTNPESKGHSDVVVAPTVDKMEVKVFPNPSVNDFKLNVKASSQDIIQVRVLDLVGRELKKMTMMPYETISLGNDLKAGAYMIEVRQGKNVSTQKVIKF